MVEIERWAGIEASVNSWLIHADGATVVVDTLRNSAEARQLADHLDDAGHRVSAILVTHGHPDHFLGLGTMAARFPDAQLLVASDAIRTSIADFAAWMTSVGWIDGEPHMKPRSSEMPDGFDYDRLTTVQGSTLTLGSGDQIELATDYPATECDVMTTLWIPAAHAFFPGDLLYVGVHSYQGPQVDRDKVVAWIETAQRLKATLPSDAVVCPGHGPITDVSAFDEMVAYLEHFLDNTQGPTTRQAASEAMITRYPAHEQADYLLTMSIDYHVPADDAG